MIRLERAVENTGSNLNVVIKSMDVDTGIDVDHWWFSDDPLSLDLNKCVSHPLGIKEGSKDFWRPWGVCSYLSFNDRSLDRRNKLSQCQDCSGPTNEYYSVCLLPQSWLVVTCRQCFCNNVVL